VWPAAATYAPMVSARFLRPRLARGLWHRVRDADISLNAAAVAYNAFLALVPLGLALFAVAAFIGESGAALQRVESTLETLAPGSVAGFVKELLVEANERVGGEQGWLIPVSLVVSIYLGSRAVVALQKALARVESRTEARPAVQMRLVAIALTLGGGLALLLTSFLLLGGARLSGFLSELTGFGALNAIWTWLQIPVSAAGLYLFLLAFYHWGPPHPLPKSWLAALVGSAGAALASLGFGLYLAFSPNLGATFGTFGAVAIALVWLYLGAFAILLGGVVVAYTLRWRMGTVAPLAEEES
jgi:membrane protein